MRLLHFGAALGSGGLELLPRFEPLASTQLSRSIHPLYRCMVLNIQMGARMDDRPLIYALAHCYHEAGHAVAFWHFGIEFSHVTLNPPANSGHFGQTVLFDREIVGLAQIEAEMQCAVAGEIAALTGSCHLAES